MSACEGLVGRRPSVGRFIRPQVRKTLSCRIYWSQGGGRAGGRGRQLLPFLSGPESPDIEQGEDDDGDGKDRARLPSSLRNPIREKVSKVHAAAAAAVLGIMANMEGTGDGWALPPAPANLHPLQD